MHLGQAAGWHPDLGHTSRHALRGCRGLAPVSQTQGGDPSLNQQSYKLRDELCACEHHVRSCCRRQIPLPTARPQRCPGRHPAPLPERDPSTALSPPSQIMPPWHQRCHNAHSPGPGARQVHPKQLPAAGCGHAKGKGTFLPLARLSWVNPAPPGLCTAPALHPGMGGCSDQRPAEKGTATRSRDQR